MKIECILFRFSFCNSLAYGKFKENIRGKCEAEGRKMKEEASAEKQTRSLQTRCRKWE